MGGPNLEIFKFSIYLFVPIVALVHFGDAKWYREKVVPYRNKLFPALDRTVQRLPNNQSELRTEITKMRAEKLARREAEETKNTI